MTEYTFRVVGDPVTEGSTRAYVRGGKAVVIHDKSSSLHYWRDLVGWAAREEMGSGNALLSSPIGIEMTFYLKKPPSVPKKRKYPVVKPDIDKLARAVLDALTGVCWRDDAEVVNLYASKRYAEFGASQGLEVRVYEV